MHNRIKAVRNTVKLTQQEFADRLGIRRGTIANYELGRNEPIDAVITLICREFNVNEHWLRTGEGEMFRPQTEREELHMLFAQFMAGDDDPDLQRFKEALFTVLLRTTKDEWRILEAKARELMDLYQGEEKAGQD